MTFAASVLWTYPIIVLDVRLLMPEKAKEETMTDKFGRSMMNSGKSGRYFFLRNQSKRYLEFHLLSLEITSGRSERDRVTGGLAISDCGSEHHRLLSPPG